MHRTLQRLLLALASLCACNKPADPQLDSANVAEVEPAPPPEVEFAGCQATRREPLTCWLRKPTTRLNLWVGSRDPPIVEVEGAVAIVHVRPSVGEAGWTIEADVPREARELRVRSSDAAPWRLPLEATEPTPTVDALEAEVPAENEPDRGRWESALAKLDASFAQLSSYESIAAGRLRMLLLNQLARRDDAAEVGYATLDRSLQAGRVGEALSIIEVLAYLAIQRRDAAEAEFLLDQQTLYLPLVADAAQLIRSDYYRGVWASSIGDFRAALEHLESAADGAQRLGLIDDELASASLRAPLLGMLGRHADRAEVVDRILALTTESPVEDRCRTAIYLSNAGWALLLARGHGAQQDIAGRLFERALAFYSPSGGCDPTGNPVRSRSLQEARINYALEALTRSDWEAATTRERAIEGAVLSPGQVPWVQYIRGELAVMRNEPAEAIAVIAGIDDAQDPLLAWQSEVLRGRAFEMLGHAQQALDAYLRAERLLDEVVLRLGVDQGREGLVAGMHSSASGAIRLLLARGDLPAASRAARRSRSRALRPIGRTEALARLSPALRKPWRDALARYREVSRAAERELTAAWRLPQDERDRALREHARMRREMRAHLQHAYEALDVPGASETQPSVPASGEVWLLFHPLGKEWIGFAITRDGTASARISVEIRPGTSPTSLAKQLLEPFDELVEQARRVDILSMGEMDDVDFQVLPFDGSPLIASKDVAYRLDIPGATSVSRARTKQTALVVADPASTRADAADLPAARAEGAQVAALMRGRGWQVTELSGSAAEYGAVTTGLAEAAWLHYAGHGMSSSGWESALPLAGEGRLDVRDVLALVTVPDAVVLSGCRTAALDRDHGADGQHLASAFLLAGSSFVIATSSDVGDAEAQEFATALYGAAAFQPAADGPRMLREALLRLAKERSGETDQWRHFRAWVP